MTSSPLINNDKNKFSDKGRIESIIPIDEIFSKDHKYWEQFWKSMDNNFFQSLKDVRLDMYIITSVNILLVAVGIAFFVNSIWLILFGKNTTAPQNTVSVVNTTAPPDDSLYAGILSGALSIGTFVGIFFIKPQRYLTRALGNMAQIQLIYKSHLVVYLNMTRIYYDKIKDKNIPLDEMIAINKEFERATKCYLQMIENNIELDKIKEDSNSDTVEKQTEKD